MSALLPAADLSAVFANPLSAVLLWGLAISGRLEPQLCRLLGLRADSAAELESQYAAELRSLRCIAEIKSAFDDEQLAGLLMLRATALALTAESAREVLHAARAARALPGWALDHKLIQLERAARYEEAAYRLEIVRARRVGAAHVRPEGPLAHSEVEDQTATPHSASADNIKLQNSPSISALDSDPVAGSDLQKGLSISAIDSDLPAAEATDPQLMAFPAAAPKAPSRAAAPKKRAAGRRR